MGLFYIVSYLKCQIYHLVIIFTIFIIFYCIFYDILYILKLF